MILVSEPVLGENEFNNVLDCLRSGWISSAGDFVEQFERDWAKYCGMKHGIAVANGTAALEIAVGCLELKPGDEVIMPSFTIISCIQAVIYNGLKPVLIDCEPDTWCIDVSQIERKVTPKTKAIMAVHMYGHPVDMDPIIELAERYGLKVIEDAAEVHGGEYKGRKCGGIGDISCFSFFANKIVTTGEGGMVLTNNDSYANRARSLRNLCFEPGRRFVHKELGYNYRLTNLQAAIGVAQVQRIDQLVEKKIKIGTYYLNKLRGTDGLQLPVERAWAKNVYWMFGIVIDETTGESANTFASKMRARGVETRPFFLGMHSQPCIMVGEVDPSEKYPITDRIAQQGLYIPSGLNLTPEIQDTVVEAMLDVLKNC